MNWWESAAILRKRRYEELKLQYPYIFKWKWYSYRKYKVRLFVWVSSFLAYFFIKLKVKPNHITAVYTVMAILGGIFLAIPSKIAVYWAIAFFFLRAFLDWTDGMVARANKQTSVDGAVFDSYGALVGVIFLWTGVGLYLGNFTSAIFYYLSPVIPALFALDLHANTRDTLIYHNILQKDKGKNSEINPENKDISSKNNIRKIKNMIDRIFEPNTRTVDFILLLILIETLTPLRILWIVYSAFLIWQVIVFMLRLFLLTRRGWAEQELNMLRKTVYE